jgi:hypothetical protein
MMLAGFEPRTVRLELAKLSSEHPEQ